MGKMRVEKASSYSPGDATHRFSAATSQGAAPPATASAPDYTAFEFGHKRASHANARQSNASRRRRRKDFSWMGIMRVKFAAMFGGVNDVLPAPAAPLPEHMRHVVPRPTSQAQTVM